MRRPCGASRESKSGDGLVVVLAGTRSCTVRMMSARAAAISKLQHVELPPFDLSPEHVPLSAQACVPFLAGRVRICSRQFDSHLEAGHLQMRIAFILRAVAARDHRRYTCPRGTEQRDGTSFQFPRAGPTRSTNNKKKKKIRSEKRAEGGTDGREPDRGEDSRRMCSASAARPQVPSGHNRRRISNGIAYRKSKGR